MNIHEQSDTENSRNGFTTKTLQTEDGQFELNTPGDRAGSFEPQPVKKHQRRFTSMDDKILFLYARGMTTREIVTTFREMYGADVSPTLIVFSWHLRWCSINILPRSDRMDIIKQKAIAKPIGKDRPATQGSGGINKI